MAEHTDATRNRLERRKARTRAALIRAAQSFIAAGQLNAPILEITQAADVGMGSFYNHFAGKEELFQAAVREAVELHGALLDQLTVGLDDPAHIFAQGFRLTGRFHRLNPELSKVLVNNGLVLVSSEIGLAVQARRDIEAAARAGRFSAVRYIDLALTIAAGTAIFLGQFLHDHPERDDAEATDLVTEDLLRTFGLPADEAHEICQRPLPRLATLSETSTAA